MTTTFSRETFLKAKAAWAEGEYGAAWEFYRHAAADRGFIFPPSGTKWDSWEDDEPSQRAIVYRAIEETPQLLQDAIRHSRSWSQVVGKLTQARDSMRDDADLRGLQDEWDRQDEPSARQALNSLATIIDRIRDSAA